MIVCLVGTSPYSFERLIKEVEKLSNRYEVFIQVGNTKYLPKNSDFIDFEEKEKLQERIKESDLIITQGGYGSMMDAIQLNKRIIAIPREEKYKELIGNQKELVNYFESKKYVVGCYQIERLEQLVEDCMNNKIEFKKHIPESTNQISNMIEEYIKNV